MAMRLNIFAQNFIDHRLVTTSLLLEKVDDVRVKSERYLLLRAGPDDRLFEKVLVKFGYFRCVYVPILHGPKPFPVRL